MKNYVEANIYDFGDSYKIDIFICSATDKELTKEIIVDKININITNTKE